MRNHTDLINTIEEVIMNLMKNAAESMCNNGEIKIKIFQRKRNIILLIQDNGSGITKEKSISNI
ncbi:MAG: hypothetical protein JWM44_2502 [Bacilli bacterium]|nr:hypothetical protein [Bacilli bacterium]